MKRTHAREKAISVLLQAEGPMTLDEVARGCRVPKKTLTEALRSLVSEGFVVEGNFPPDLTAPRFRWRARATEERTQRRRRVADEFPPVSPGQYVDFMLRWQYVHPDTMLRDAKGLRQVIDRLQTHDDLIRLWERDYFPARVRHYKPAMIDKLIRSGEVLWGTFNFGFLSDVPPRLRLGT